MDILDFWEDLVVSFYMTLIDFLLNSCTNNSEFDIIH